MSLQTDAAMTKSPDRSAPLRRIAVSLFFAFLGVPFATAEKLPVKVYTVADGLGMDQVNVVHQDARNLLWFGTSDGVSWFDGYQFVTYTTDDGLPSRLVSDILETRSGELWLATAQGLCLFRRDVTGDNGKQHADRFLSVVPKDSFPAGFQVDRLLEAPDGSLWCATLHGLFRLKREGPAYQFERVEMGLRNARWADTYVHDLVYDEFGTLWLAVNSGLYGRRPDGRVIRPGTASGLPEEAFSALVATGDGVLWAGGIHGLLRVRLSDKSDRPASVDRFTIRDGLPANRVLALKLARDGRLWVGTFGGLARLDADSSPPARIISYTTANGLTDVEITALDEDDDNNLWVGTDHGGVLKITRQGFDTFDASDGLAGVRANLGLQDRAGQIVFQMNVDRKFFACFDGKSFKSVRLPGTEQDGWVGVQGVLQDRRGGWWVATGRNGLYYYDPADAFASLGGRRPSRVYSERDGLSTNKVFGLFEDSRGYIWIALQDGPHQLSRLDPRTGRLSNFKIGSMPLSLAEDREGNVWIGLLANGIVRYRNGRLTHFSTEHGFPRGGVYHLYVDRQGLLWASSLSSGALRVSNPSSERPVFTALTTKDGLSSNHVRFVMEGNDGAFYIGTARGLDRWDQKRGLIRHFTTGDGLAGNLQNVGLLDRAGNLWLGTFLGISRLVPQAEGQPRPADIYVRGLSLGGIPWPVDELGQIDVLDVRVPIDRNRVSINFAGVSFAPGEVLTYRYRLAGRDSEWRTLGGQRRLDLVDIQPGDYRIELQALNSDGFVSPRPATVSLTILAPIWRRWWFIGSIVILCGGIAWTMERLRVRRRLEMERIRTRIATDLHDDIGSSLSQISILCEVAVRRMSDDPSAAVQSLSQATETSRSLVDSMSDIVWAINPARDGLSDLVHRMRRFANDLFAEGNVVHRFDCFGAERDLTLGNDVRRQVYLVYKECLHNVVKHAQATEVLIELRLRGSCLELRVEDNGAGFHPEGAMDAGNGLRNLKRRAEGMGGRLTIDSRPGEGTRIAFHVGVNASRRCRRSVHTYTNMQS